MRNHNGLSITALLGCTLAMIGIVGGATGALSGDLPLFLAGFGCAAVYCSIAIMGAISLWNMEK